MTNEDQKTLKGNLFLNTYFIILLVDRKDIPTQNDRFLMLEAQRALEERRQGNQKLQSMLEDRNLGSTLSLQSIIRLLCYVVLIFLYNALLDVYFQLFPNHGFPRIFPHAWNLNRMTSFNLTRIGAIRFNFPMSCCNFVNFVSFVFSFRWKEMEQEKGQLVEQKEAQPLSNKTCWLHHCTSASSGADSHRRRLA